MNTIEEIANVLKNAKSAVIFTHMRPDGDTLGSGMALSRALSMLKIPNEVVNEGEVPQKFYFLEGMRSIKRSPTIDAQMLIFVDISEPARLGQAEQYFWSNIKKRITVNIDHHISNTHYARYNFVRERSSNCENMAEIISLIGVKPDKLVSNYLMLGMVTDSGAFSHSDVDGNTFRAAAYAVDGGADVNRIYYEMMKRQSKDRASMYAEVIGKLRYFNDNTLVFALVTQDVLSKYNLKTDATEGIVDFGLSIDGVEVSICLLEMKRGQYKASLRSKGRVNVNEVARVFGGGGHILASGCMLFGDIEEVYDKLRYAVWQHSGDL